MSVPNLKLYLLRFKISSELSKQFFSQKVSETSKWRVKLWMYKFQFVQTTYKIYTLNFDLN